MANWYRLNLGDPMLAEQQSGELKARAEAQGETLYARHESEGQLHCDLIVYFASDASDLAHEFGARICDDPGEGLAPL